MADNLTPQFPQEEWYQGMLDSIDGNAPDLTPKYRQEEWYQALIDALAGIGTGTSNLKIYVQGNTLYVTSKESEETEG